MSMLVCKNSEDVPNNHLKVDEWKVTHTDNLETGDSVLTETYAGMVNIDKTSKQKYICFQLSSKGDNMKNINMMKTKSIWIIRKYFQDIIFSFHLHL